ncbi:DUF4339 domain-containing protein [Candidatus Chlamydia sanziniae]|uniref:Leader peptide-periplasmic n=1 Tax=Candidatus Chlamydia sanziniae TaxID=1806891 RepID=A0A1A9HWC9_9CHLA|nr:DUF4339 domain-containing protein [Candidatus Chlamydia sanziniae]ANH78731.1 leader peptide-periplasmic [Candidatus Chlamydia sanziniae]
MLPSILPISFFLFYFILGCLSAYIARKKNRNVVGWFFAGVFFGFIGIIILLFLSSLPENNLNSSQTSLPDNSVFLDNFKEVKKATEVIPSGDLQQVAIDTEKWFYLDKEHHNVGPISLEDLFVFLRNTELHAKENTSPQEIWIWKKGMHNWERAKNIPELKEALETSE